MDTWQAIDTTRAIRKFGDRPLEPVHLQRILDAGRRAGSSKNSQRWDFVACTDRVEDPLQVLRLERSVLELADGPRCVDCLPCVHVRVSAVVLWAWRGWPATPDS